MYAVRGSRISAKILQNVAKYGSRRAASTHLATKRSLHPGDEIRGYTVQSVVPVPEFSLTAVYLHHKKTGAQHLHIDREDLDNVFGVALRTTPLDSTGVPHILEHLTLCGSERYPVRDPFFKMYARSLSTFMNAFTASDWTMYPFSTQNIQDYENLMSVYLDAVFFPRLRQQDFRQEGWRLEHEDSQNPHSPIVFKGVVFNEMKGAFSNAQQLFAEKNQNLLLPSHTYGVVSGGHPHSIPDLTWNQLKAFHMKHYHPSNSRFYTYGNFPLERHLQLIEELVLNKFEKVPLDTSVPLEPRWNGPKECHISCAPDPMSPDPNKSTTIAVSFLLDDITNVFDSCTLSILGSLLVDGEKSPFYQSLLESNIGSDYSPVVGYNGFTRESSFAIGLQRIDKKDVEEVKKIIDATFDKIIESGFERERIEAILHKIELSQKHQAEKFGLHLGISLLPCWTHDGDPVRLIQVNKQVEWFKDQLNTNPRYLQDVVKKYFKENVHRLTLVMSPDETFDVKNEEIETKKLESFVKKLSDNERDVLFKEGLELAEVQNRKEDVSCLPSLKIEDIEREIERTETTIVNMGGTALQLCVQPTNGVTYFRAVSSFAFLPQHLKRYVPLFCNIVTKIGAGKRNYKDLSEEIELRTGGLNVTTHVVEHHRDEDQFEQSILFSSYCLDRNTSNMFDLWTDIFNSLSLTDVSRLKTLIMMTAAEMSSGLSDQGHRYAMTHSASTLRSSSAIKEEMSGIAQMTLMKQLADTSDLDQIISHLREIANHVLTSNALRCSLNTTQVSVDSAIKETEKFIGRLPQVSQNTDPANFYAKDTVFIGRPTKTHFEFPFQVQYIGKSLTTVPFSHPDYASLQILSKLMTTKFLHKEIREKGGAYGGGASAASNLFYFYSYRDPNLQKTLEAFDDSVTWAINGDVTQQEIVEAKLSVFAQVDSPIPPGSKGMRRFLNGINEDSFLRYRELLLDVTGGHLVSVANKYLKNKVCSVTVLGPNNQTTANSSEWTIKTQD